MSGLVVLPPMVLISLLVVKADPSPREKTKPSKNDPPKGTSSRATWDAANSCDLNKNNSNNNDTEPRGWRSKMKIQKKKKRRYWPHWCRYLGWGPTILSIAVAAFFTILYSLEFEGEKSRAWLIAFFLSFVESVLLLQPVKVCTSLINT